MYVPICYYVQYVYEYCSAIYSYTYSMFTREQLLYCRLVETNDRVSNPSLAKRILFHKRM